MNIKDKINQVSQRLTSMSVSSENTDAIIDSGNSLGEAREALESGDIKRASELVKLADEQLDCGEP